LLQVLHDAVLNGSDRVVQLLLEARAEPASQDGARETPLSLAVLVGQWGCAQALLLSPGGAGAVQVTAVHTFIHGPNLCSVCLHTRIPTPWATRPWEWALPVAFHSTVAPPQLAKLNERPHRLEPIFILLIPL
jgi:hypothetical protein